MSLVVTRREGDNLFLGLNRPEKHNALDEELVDELTDALEHAHEPAVLVIHSTTPGVFVSGADIARLRARRAGDAMRRINGQLFDRIAAYPWPSIAAIDGPALGGGCELALACDFRIATPKARFGHPEPRLGVMAAAGGNWRLPELIGLQRARRMLLANETLGAEAAETAGLVDRVVASEELLPAVHELAERIAGATWQALELTKLALASQGRSSTAAIDAVGQAILFESEEKDARMAAFLNGRTK